MTPEETALRTTYGVWAWLLALDERSLTADEVLRIVTITRELYFAVLELETPQLSLVARRV